MTDEFNRGKREGIQVMADMVTVMIPDFEKRIKSGEEFLLNQFTLPTLKPGMKPKDDFLKVSNFVMYHKPPKPVAFPEDSSDRHHETCLAIVTEVDPIEGTAGVMLIDGRAEAGSPPQFRTVPLEEVRKFRAKANHEGPATYGRVKRVEI